MQVNPIVGVMLVITVVIWLAFTASCFSPYLAKSTSRTLMWIAMGFSVATLYGSLLSSIPT